MQGSLPQVRMCIWATFHSCSIFRRGKGLNGKDQIEGGRDVGNLGEVVRYQGNGKRGKARCRSCDNIKVKPRKQFIDCIVDWSFGWLFHRLSIIAFAHYWVAGEEERARKQSPIHSHSTDRGGEGERECNWYSGVTPHAPLLLLTPGRQFERSQAFTMDSLPRVSILFPCQSPQQLPCQLFFSLKSATEWVNYWKSYLGHQSLRPSIPFQYFPQPLPMYLCL